MDACGCDGFTEIFDARTARHDLSRYRRHGPDGTTALLLDMLRAADVRGRTLLDIGAGIGVIDHELLRDGLERAVLVDGSPAYQAAARDESAKRGTLDRLAFVEGDFVRVADRVEGADVVTLDRVVCCYRDVDALVRASSRKAARLYGLVPAARSPADPHRAGRHQRLVSPASARLPRLRPPECARGRAGGRGWVRAGVRGDDDLLAGGAVHPGRDPGDIRPVAADAA